VDQALLHPIGVAGGANEIATIEREQPVPANRREIGACRDFLSLRTDQPRHGEIARAIC